MHNHLNKALTGQRFLYNPENKRDILQNIQNNGVMGSLEIWRGTILRLADSVSTLPPILNGGRALGM
jgi:hypothetical protein